MQFKLSQYLKIIKAGPTVSLSTMEMKWTLTMDVDWHYVVNSGILEVEMHLNDRWVQKQFNKLK